MKFLVAIVLAMAVAAANSQAVTKQPYVVPIYRVTMDATSSSTGSTASTSGTTVTTTGTTTPTTVTTTATTTPTTVTTTGTTTPTTVTTTATTTPTTVTTTATTTPTTVTTTATTTPTTVTTTAATTPTTVTTTAATTPTTVTTTAATTPTTVTTTAATTPTTVTTTVATTPTTVTTTVATTPTTVTTAATSPEGGFFSDFSNFFEARLARHPRSLDIKPRGMEGHSYVHVCSGTLVDSSSIITTVTCAELAKSANMNPYVATAADASSLDSAEKVYYEVINVHKHPGYDATTNTNNIAVLKLSTEVDYSLSDKIDYITWALEVPAVADKCVTNYWSTVDPFEQVNNNVTVKACSPLKNGTICSDYPTANPQCPAGTIGAALVCNDKIAGLFTPKNGNECTTTTWQYEELSKDATWIWESVNAAPILNVSFAAILALVTVMLKSL